MPTAFFVVVYGGTALALIATLFFMIDTARIQRQIDQELRRAKARSRERLIEQATRREIERRATWIESEIERALPAPVVWALRATGWLWLARLTGVTLNYRRHADMSTTIEVVRRGRIVAHRRFTQPKV